jgi:hypothetical protein
MNQRTQTGNSVPEIAAGVRAIGSFSKTGAFQFGNSAHVPPARTI